MWLSLGSGAVALLLSLLLTPIVRNTFLKLGLVDKPDEFRKLHANDIPRVGGIAIFLSYISAFLFLRIVAAWQTGPLFSASARHWGLLGSVLVIFGTGLADDLFGFSPRKKLIGQFAAAILVWMAGVQIHVFHDFALGAWVSLPLTVLWLLVCTNAVNLIDGLDGLAAGAGLVATGTVLVAALHDHNEFLALVTLPLAGALLGFLRYNFNPATIFLGDSGSLTVGFLLGCFSILWSEKITTVVGLAAPLMALSLPLTDTGLAILRRVLRNQPIFSGDRGHIHHRLLDQGNSPRQTALLLYGAGLVAALFAWLAVTVRAQLSGLVLLGFLAVAYAGVRYLRYLEFGFARRFFVKGMLFSFIDDQMRVATLEKALSVTNSFETAVIVVKRACLEFGFSEVSVVPRWQSYDMLDALNVQAQIAIPLGQSSVLILHGMPRLEGPLALSQLLTVIARHFGTAETTEKVLTLPAESAAPTFSGNPLSPNA